ncbi:hypothetical protein HID58_008482 [Brassica napus]|uniref:Uncharacterized protein n=1 Tax=Brassica napus TaxID=3708 RepID=A0ABQ8DPR1_BRANA|nr:hypothetical protein HID58_008482 [Brassica napus]
MWWELNLLLYLGISSINIHLISHQVKSSRSLLSPKALRCLNIVAMKLLLILVHH